MDYYKSASYIKKNGDSYKVSVIVLELAKSGNLFQFIRVNRLSERMPNLARTYFHTLINTLEFIHSQNITHRDIKPENFLLDENLNLKIADFGFATNLKGIDGDEMLEGICGTENYKSPELLEKRPYSGREADLFALGVSLFMMYTTMRPFEAAMVNDPNYKLLMNEKMYKEFWENQEKKFKKIFCLDTRR